MTPKEKAFELVQRFSKLEKGLDEKEWFKIDVYFNGNNKQCALICVDEMIKERQILNNDFDRDRIIELKEVKQEINKL
jgi:hypothetical protein